MFYKCSNYILKKSAHCEHCELHHLLFVTTFLWPFLKYIKCNIICICLFHPNLYNTTPNSTLDKIINFRIINHLKFYSSHFVHGVIAERRRGVKTTNFQSIIFHRGFANVHLLAVEHRFQGTNHCIHPYFYI